MITIQEDSKSSNYATRGICPFTYATWLLVHLRIVKKVEIKIKY
jgi:hypothetical protein